MIADADLVALNIMQEAGAEIDDGKAAIARVTLNRMNKKFFSDGTVTGTVLTKDQFSWAWFEFVTVHTGTAAHDESHQEYVRCCYNLSDAERRAQGLLAQAKGKFPNTFAKANAIGHAVFANVYRGTLYDQLTDEAVLYCNPRILTKLPPWAIPTRLIVSIGHHDFYGG